MTDIVYPSKTDRWLRVAFAVSTVGALAACVPLVCLGSHVQWLVVAPTLLLGIGLPWWIVTSTAYTVTTDTLVVRSGPFRWYVPFEQIRAIAPTRSPLSSPALSLDRLRIDYGSTSLMISPEDRERFLADLRARGVACA